MSIAEPLRSNRHQMIMHQTRLTFEKVFGLSEQQLHMNLVYDVAHNITKVERHLTNGEGTYNAY